MSKYNKGDIIGPSKTLLVSDCWKEGKNTYLCKAKCSFCGKIFIARVYQLASGHTKSCGCYKKQILIENNKKYFIDLSGKKFGKLTVLTPIEENGRREKFLCQCECGKKTIVRSSNLISGHTSSCGTCILSKGNLAIEKFLKNKKIIFDKEYCFKDCINPKTNCQLRFDFYLPGYNCCIEYDGEQHFIAQGWITVKDLEQNQYRDNIKNQYCQNNNIKLIRIPYWKYNDINTILSKEIF